MRSFGLPDTPFWALFRLKWKQTWPADSRRKALVAFIVLLVVQAVITLAALHTLRPWQPAMATIVGSIVARLGLISGFWTEVAGSLPGLQGLGYHHWLAPAWVPALLVETALRFVMPAYAATSLAPDRKEGRLAEYRLAGLAPRQVYLAAALAAVLPFIVLALASVAVGVLIEASGQAWVPGGKRPIVASRLLDLVVWATTFVTHTGVLVSISALCRRVPTALALCYATQLLLFPLLRWAAEIAARFVHVRRILGMPLYVTAPDPLMLIVSLAALAAVLPKAIRALEREDG